MVKYRCALGFVVQLIFDSLLISTTRTTKEPFSLPTADDRYRKRLPPFVFCIAPIFAAVAKGGGTIEAAGEFGHRAAVGGRAGSFAHGFLLDSNGLLYHDRRKSCFLCYTSVNDAS